MTSPRPSREALRRKVRRQSFFISTRPRTLGFGLRLLVVLGMLWAVPVAAQEPGGRFISVQGEVQVLRDSQTLPATVGLPVKAGDVIRTGANARAAILLSDGTQLKLAPNSTIQIKQVSPRRPGKITPVAAGGLRTVLQFFLGESWLRSTAPADQLEIETPTATAATKGTEFALAVAPDGVSTLAVVDGLVQYANPRGTVLVVGGEEATAQVGQAPTKRILLNPLDAVQWSLYYPGTLSPQDYPTLSPVERANLAGVLAPARAERLEEAEAALAAALALPPPVRRTLTALIALGRGQAPEAKAALAAALELAPTDAAAHALLAEVALVQNRLASAEAEAERSLAATRASPSAWLALSHVRQAQFQLEAALAAAEQAAALDPQDVRALVQAATLLFGTDRTDDAWTLTQRASSLAPGDAPVLSLLGFLQLARGETEVALATFHQASQADPSLGEPYLGAGLARFRLGQIEAGLEALQAATLLDSQVSLFQSYLGKGLYQAGEREAGLKALARAAALDPRDPTPHLYRGIFLADLNRPAESIAALQTAVALNDYRGVYRSRLLLDRDLATKNADLARSYRALGQTERARLTAIKSIEEDPSNSAAHFLFNQVILAEGRTGALQFRAINRERLLTRLLLPVNENSFNTFNDYTMLLEQPRLFGTASAQVNGEPEGHNLQLILDGGTPRVAFRQELSQIEDQGVKPENDDLLAYSTFTLGKVATGLRSSLLVDGGYQNARSGDKSQDFAFFSAPNHPNQRRKDWAAFGELGYQMQLTPESQLLLRASTDWSADTTARFDILPLSGPVAARVRNRNDFFAFEGLYLLRAGAHRLSLGVDYLFGHLSVNGSASTLELIPPIEVVRAQRLRQEFLSPFIQDTWFITPRLRLTGAFHLDYARDPSPGINRLTNTTLYSFEANPQVGLTWEVTPQHTIRAAIMRSLVTGNPEPLSPTQIAGFLIEEHPTTSTRIWQSHLAWDAALGRDTFVQAALFYVNRDIPMTAATSPTTVQFADSRRLGGRLTLEQLLPGGVGLSLDYQHVRRIDEGDDDQLRAKLRYVHSSGFMAGWRTIYAHQTLDLGLPPGAPTDPVFHDLFVAYELPQKRGLLAVGVDNLFNQRFNLVSDFLNINSEEFPVTEFIRDRIPTRRVFVFARVNF